MQEQKIQSFDRLKKKIKQQEIIEVNQQYESNFLQSQYKNLQLFLQKLKEYPKITALQIQHQQRSINKLPKQILAKFKQLRQRVNKSIECCKINSQFLQQVRKSLSLNLKLNKKFENQNIHQNNLLNSCKEHLHSHNNYQSNKITNIFLHLCRQYSNQQISKSQRQYIDFTVKRISEFIKENIYEQLKILNIGSGMGRMLAQIKELSQNSKIKQLKIQGHEQEQEYYLLSEFMLNYNTKQHIIYPYIHNFSNHLKSQTPYIPVKICPISKQPVYPITFGSFYQLYRSHNQEWKIIVSTFYNYSIKDILLYIQVIYKILQKGGIWIDISTCSFQKHLTACLSYGEYQNIIQKSQFKLLQKFNREQLWYKEPNKLMTQWRKVYYRVMKKQ